MHAVSIDAPRTAGAAAPSFPAVAEELLDDVYGYLLYLTKDWALAEDLTGETFETALRRWRKFDPVGRPPAPGCSRSRARPHSTGSAPSRGRREQRAGAREPREPSSFGEGLSPELEDGLRSLTAGEREVIASRVVLELDGEETARLLGISPTAVSTRLHRAPRGSKRG